MEVIPTGQGDGGPHVPLHRFEAPTAYKILTAWDTERLAYMVRDAMGRGWLPLGGVSVRSFETGHHVEYMQAICRYKD